eukprot:4506335-Alexandrium_andersonii.AAC.1
MSASLVGSEMCIRDRGKVGVGVGKLGGFVVWVLVMGTVRWSDGLGELGTQWIACGLVVSASCQASICACGSSPFCTSGSAITRSTAW